MARFTTNGVGLLPAGLNKLHDATLRAQEELGRMPRHNVFPCRLDSRSLQRHSQLLLSLAELMMNGNTSYALVWVVPPCELIEDLLQIYRAFHNPVRALHHGWPFGSGKHNRCRRHIR